MFLASEKAIIRLDPARTEMAAIAKAIEGTGCSLSTASAPAAVQPSQLPLGAFTRVVLTFFGVVFGAVLLLVVVGEWLGLIETLTACIPWPVWLAIVAVGGSPVFRNVWRAARRRRICRKF